MPVPLVLLCTQLNTFTPVQQDIAGHTGKVFNLKTLRSKTVPEQKFPVYFQNKKSKNSFVKFLISLSNK